MAEIAVDRYWLSVLMALCCVPSVVYWIRAHRLEYGSVRAAPTRLAGACVDGVMMGLGAGLGATVAVWVACGLLYRIYG